MTQKAIDSSLKTSKNLSKRKKKQRKKLKHLELKKNN